MAITKIHSGEICHFCFKRKENSFVYPAFTKIKYIALPVSRKQKSAVLRQRSRGSSSDSHFQFADVFLIYICHS